MLCIITTIQPRVHYKLGIRNYNSFSIYATEEHRVIKATSSYLSLIMFVGCYLLCLSVMLTVNHGIYVTSPQTHSIIVCFYFAASFNGVNLIMFTLLLKLLCVRWLFNFSRLTCRSHHGKCWSDVFLFFVIILLNLILN